MVRAAGSRDAVRYAKDHQEQQGYFEEGMQLIYHYGGMNVMNDNASRDGKFNDTRRAKRAHPEGATDVRIDVDGDQSRPGEIVWDFFPPCLSFSLSVDALA